MVIGGEGKIHAENPMVVPLDLFRADPREFRCCVLWLEDQRIRHYDDRERERRLRDGGDADKWEAGR